MVGRKKLNRTSLHARVNPQTINSLKDMAKELGLIYTNNAGQIEGSTGKLLDVIAKCPFLIPLLKAILLKSG